MLRIVKLAVSELELAVQGGDRVCAVGDHHAKPAANH